MISPAYDTHSRSNGVYLTSNLQVFVCFYSRPSVTYHIKLRADKRRANPQRLLLKLMQAKESKQMTHVRWHVFTTRGPRAEHVQFAAISDRSLMALRT
jgi:hypothetical protein